MSKKTWWQLSLAVTGSYILLLLTCTPGLPHPQKTPAAEISTDYGVVVINEIAWAGTQAATYDEWIELYNTTGYTINLSMWQLEASDYGPDIPLSGTIPPHNYYLLERGDDTTIQNITANLVYGSNYYIWALSNDGEALTLTNATGEVIDRVNTRSRPWPGGHAAPAYTTMERINAQVDGDRIANWATFTGPGNGLDAAGNPVQGTPNRRNSVAVADITVKKSGATWCTTGALVSYTIALENTGYITATNTRLTDTLPPSTTFINQKSPFNFIQPDRDMLVWDVGEIAPQITRTTITLYVETAIQTGTLRNIITATTGTPETNTDNNQDYWDTTIQPPTANLTLSKTGPLEAIAGSTITYTLTLTNTGTRTAYAIYITDTLLQNTDDNLTWDLAQLPPGSYKSISFSLNLAETLIGTITNTAQATHSTGQQTQAHWVTSITPTQPTLKLEKTAPATARNGENITYHLVLSNTGPLAAHGTIITDTLSQGLIYLRQDSTYTHTRISPRVSRWDLGSLPSQATGEITLTAAMVTQNTFTGTLTNTAVTHAQGKLPYTVTATTRVLPQLYLYALQPGNYGGISGEAAAITNGDNRPINLRDWCITDRLKASKRVCFPEGAVIQPGQILWLAQDADGFYPIWGMDPDWASETGVRQVSLLQGEWPGFTDDGESLYLLAPNGAIADVLAYGKGNVSTGWSGPSVPFPYSGYEIKGQVLYRKLDPNTGQPVPDTDRADDWAQDPEDTFNGRKLRYPGWDLETLFFPLNLTTTANITVAVAPDAMLNLVTQTLAKAQASIRIGAYTLGSTAIYNALEERIQAGVVITALLDANPAGGMEPVEKWVAQQLHAPPQSIVYFLGGESPRYRYQHAKFMLIDESLSLISTDNFGENSAPSDPKSNGTQGHRGFVLVTDQPQITGYLKWLFALDCDPVQHNDIFPYT
ncbi:MAG: DUF11 domain-containing protein, partial [Anaerolineae bacterium]|nr:DUF11 domain-containing protein [Anaerolineae bacterium]